MGKNEEYIDRLFRDRLQSHEVEPPAGAWEAIRSEINRKKQRKLVWIRTAAASAILLLSLATGYFIGNSRHHRSMAQSSVQNTVTPRNEAPLPSVPVNKSNKEQKNSGKASPIFAPDQQIIITASSEPFMAQTEVHITAYENTTVNVDNPTKPGLSSSELTPVPGHDAKISFTEQQLLLPGISERLALAPSSLPDDEIQVDLDEKKPGNQPVSRFSVGGDGTPVLAYRDIQKKSSTGNSQFSNEEPLSTFAAGLHVQYKVSRRFGLQTGLYYSGMGMQISASSFSSGNKRVSTASGVMVANENFPGVNNSTGEINALSLYSKADENLYTPNTFAASDNAHIIQQFGYLEVPLLLKYRVIDSKIGLSMIGGLACHYMVSNKVFLKSSGGKSDIGSTQDVSEFNYSGAFGIGMEYAWSKKLFMSLEPTMNYYINPSYKTTTYTTHPYSFGVYTGINYCF